MLKTTAGCLILMQPVVTTSITKLSVLTEPGCSQSSQLPVAGCNPEPAQSNPHFQNILQDRQNS